MKNRITVFWFRRDLRLEDNKGLSESLQLNNKVLPLFIFDEDILGELPKDDARVSFIYDTLKTIDKTLKLYSSSLLVKIGKPLDIWKELINKHNISLVYANKDYEPYASNRDKQVKELLAQKNIQFKALKDQVIFEEKEVLKNDGLPYTVFTPFKNKWLRQFTLENDTHEYKIDFGNFYQFITKFPTIKSIGFKRSKIKVKPYNLSSLNNYNEFSDFPSLNKTSYLSPHLRFGTVSIRKMVHLAYSTNIAFLSELIWREFFMQILFHYPKVITDNFKPKYDNINWRNNVKEFEKWCNGETGYPIVDAGMKELNMTGYMHNRVRMITASFLCKHLLIDWRWGEAYFAKKLIDFELATNNGNWQWVAGTGCDAAPYFRIFNPKKQTMTYDNNLDYIKKWVPNFQELTYPKPIVEHKYARERCLKAYKEALNITH